MALPTAQLGSMPSLNVPSYIPTVQISKEPKLWEKALMSMLANAGSAVVSQGVQNMMQPDYAPDPATGLERFLHGPKINQARAGELDRQVIEQQRIDDANRQARLNRMVEMTGQNKVLANQAAQQTLSTENEIGNLMHQGAAEDTQSMQARQAVLDARVRRLQDEIANVRQGKVADAQIKNLTAETGLREEQTREARNTRETTERVMNNTRGKGQKTNAELEAEKSIQAVRDPIYEKLITALQAAANPQPSPVGVGVVPQNLDLTDAARQALILKFLQ